MEAGAEAGALSGCMHVHVHGALDGALDGALIGAISALDGALDGAHLRALVRDPLRQVKAVERDLLIEQHRGRERWQLAVLQRIHHEARLANSKYSHSKYTTRLG